MKEKYSPEAIKALKRLVKKGKPEFFTEINEKGKTTHDTLFNPMKRLGKCKNYKNEEGAQALKEVFDRTVNQAKALDKAIEKTNETLKEEKNDK